MQEKEIQIDFSRIYNWPFQNQPIDLIIEVYSKYSQHLITRKQVSSITCNNYLDLHTSLKISYAKEQNTIIVIVSRNNLGKEKMIGEAEIDLNELRERKMLHFDFENSGKVLQVELGKEEDSAIITSDKRDKHRKFLEKRKKFIEKYNDTQNMLKQQFEQSISWILGHDFKEKNPVKGFNSKQVSEIYEEEFCKKRDSEVLQMNMSERNSIYGAKSQEKVNNLMNFKEKAMSPPVPNRKHKLMLNTLNIVQKKQ